MRTPPKTTSLLAPVTMMLALVAAGCSTATDGPGLVEGLKARHHAGAGATPFRDVSELLGNHRFQAGDKIPEPLTVAVVRGTVSSVEDGRAFKVEGSDAPSGTVTDFDDEQALWRTFHATVETVETLSGTVPKTITVGLAFGPDATREKVESDLTAMGDVVFFLTRTPVFGYDSSVYGTVGDGAYLATVDDQGKLALPVLDPAEAHTMLSNGGTIADLRAKAKGAPVVIKLDPTGTERLPAA